MRVLLVNTNREQAPYPVPPLGLCLLAAGLEGRHEVRVFDGCFEELAGLCSCVEEFQPECVGLGIRNIDDVVMDRPVWRLDEIRERFVEPLRALTAAPLVLGGAGFSLFPAQLLAELDADFGLVGEGEEAFLGLLDALAGGRVPPGLPRVLGRSTAGILPEAAGPASRPDGRLTIPHSTIDRFLSFAPYRHRGSYPIQTKRGCRHQCLYCSYVAIEGSCYRVRDAADIVDEMEEIRGRLGDVTIELVDSTFNDPPGHAETICREIRRRNMSFRLRTMGVNPGALTPALVALMREAGFAQIDCTADSASPAMLTSLRKNFDRGAVERTARSLAQADMPTMWFFMFGGPGETAQTVAETFDFVDRFVAPEDMVHLTCGLRVYPGTGLRDVAVAQGLIDRGDSLLRPTFYVEPALGAERLKELVLTTAASRPNCVPAWESTPPPAMLAAAVRLRAERGLAEPMFRTLLRLRRGATG
jgi:radical SAM superfamily enzyme YgiQ (UPF0313 family)